MTFTEGTSLGVYKIISPIGKGGMGEVWRARDTKLGREVAVKTLPEEFAQDPLRLARFEQEARMLASVSHPNIAAIYGLEEVQGTRFLVLELVEGETLAARLRRGSIPIEECVRLGVQVTDALDAAHQRGVIHRDIKPPNIVVNARGQVKILDFGLATTQHLMADPSALPTAGTLDERLTSPGEALGTVAYMSPEQARGEAVDARTDLFSIGVVLYEMATGSLAFPGTTSAVIFDSILNRDPAGLGQVHTPLGVIIRKALEKDPAFRYQTAAEMRTDLRRLERDASKPKAAVTPKKRTRRTRKAIQSMAVLPLATKGDDPDSEYLSEGIAESLINSLAQLPKLRVAQRHKSFRYTGDVDLQEAARELDVQAILWGRVLVRGTTLVVKMELIDIERDEQVWGQQYTKTLDDIFVLQDEIANEVVDALKLKLTGAKKKTRTPRPTRDADAYHLYMKGRFYWARRTPDNTQKALEYFKQAVEKDPNYALAYAGMADCYAILGFTPYGKLPPKEAYPRAKAAARKALALDRSQGEAHATLGMCAFFYDWDWAESEREFRRALELAPDSMGARIWFPFMLSVIGRHDEAVREAKRAVQIDALSVNALTMLGQVLFNCRRFDEAAATLSEALELDPNYPTALFFLGMVHRVYERFSEAITLVDKAAEVFPDPFWQAEKAWMWAVAGRTEDATRVLEELKELAERTYVSPMAFCFVYNGLGAAELFYETLEAGIEERSGLVTMLQTVLYDGWRSDLRFQDLVRRVGLPEIDSAQ